MLNSKNVHSKLQIHLLMTKVSAQNMGVNYFSFMEKFNFDSYTGKFTIRYHL